MAIENVWPTPGSTTEHIVPRQSMQREGATTAADATNDRQIFQTLPAMRALDPSVLTGVSQTAIFDALAIPVIRLDAAGIVTAWNRGAEALLGYTAREAIGSGLPTVPPEEGERFDVLLANVLRGETATNLVTEHIHKEGHRVAVLLSAEPWREGGSTVGALYTLADRSPQEARERELKRRIAAEARRTRDAVYIAAVAEQCGAAVDEAAVFAALARRTADWADSAGVMTATDTGSDLTAYAARTAEADGAVAALFHGFALSHSNAADTPRRYYLREVPLTGGARAQGYHTLAAVPIAADGTPIATLYAAARGVTAPLDDTALATLARAAAQAGQAVATLRAQQTLKERADALEAAARQKDAFLATVSHELRTPLTAILGFAHIIVENDALGADRRRGMAEDIVASGGLLLTQVNDLLDIVQLGAGRLTVVPEVVDASAVIQWCERAVQALMNSKGLTFSHTIPTNLPPVRANKARLEQVLLNLLVNAYKFTPAGGTVAIEATATHGTVAIAVRDTGIGIAPEHVVRIFEPFERIETEYTRTQAGAGVGLAVARHLVGMMGGTISLQSAVNVGSTFTITLERA